MESVFTTGITAMLHPMEKLIGLTLHASDGDIGTVRDIYFDDRRWALRYLIVETGSWLDSRRVLISPVSVESVDWTARTVHLRLTRQQVKGSPDIDTHKPVSRQHELDYLDYYGYPDYLSGSLLWGLTPYPVAHPGDLKPYNNGQETRASESADPHLRSRKEVVGYDLQAADGPLGYLQDFLVESGSWAIRYVVVDTSKWWIGKQVVIPSPWISQIDWVDKSITVDVARGAIEAAPEYRADGELLREDEVALFTYYNRPDYWS